jgi:putative acetyltransferase
MQINQAGRRCFVAREHDRGLGCGAFVLSSDGHSEMTRVFVDPAARGMGVAFGIMEVLEPEVARVGTRRCKLETGVKQPETIALSRRDRLGLAAVHPCGNHTPAPRISSTIRSLVLASGWS